MWGTRRIPGLGTGVVQRSWGGLAGCRRAAVAGTGAAFGAVAPSVHSADTHERLHHLLTGRRGRLIKIAFGLGVAGCLFVIAVSILWLRLASGPLSLDMLTPWLTAAIEERLGGPSPGGGRGPPNEPPRQGPNAGPPPRHSRRDPPRPSR